MKLFKTILRPLWKIWFVLWFVIPFLVLYPFFYIALVTRHFDFVFRLKRVWARIISLGSFLYPQVTYKSARYALPRPCVVVSNHTSYLDIIFSPFYVDHTGVFMGKYELLKIPLFKSFFKYLDIPVNRRSVTDAHRAFREAGSKLDQGYSQIIYPEGTISEAGILKPFKNGAFKLAIERQVPVIPIVNLNNWHFLQNGGFFKSNGAPGIPLIIVGDPISTKGMTEKDVTALKEKVFTFIRLELERYNGKD